VKKKPILLLGAGGHARACIDVIEQNGFYEVAGLVGLAEEAGTNILGYSVIGVDNNIPELLKEFTNVLIAIGQIKTHVQRERLFNTVMQNGGNLQSVISPSAYVSKHAKIGDGTIVMHGAIVNAGASVGKNCILNSQSLIEHDSVIADHCHIATSATINSGVTISSGTFIGSNCSVRQRTNIGEHCVIGMGQNVLSDCAAGTWLPKRLKIKK